VLIEAELEGAYRGHSREFTEGFFVIVSLPPGKYRYRVIPYNFLGRPEPEQSSAWRSFVIPAIVSSPQAGGSNVSQEPDEPIFLPEFDNSIASGESGDPGAKLEPEESADDRNRKAAHLWTVGVSAGTSLYRPWLIATLHATFAPLPYSFLEAGIDIGLGSEDSQAQYYSLFPFAHYAFFLPFPTKGGWYIGGGGGYWMSAYSDPVGAAEENKAVVDFIAGLNLVNMFDISYTLRTDFKGLSHKFSLGYVYRFK
jgi:hypothetical protein